VIYVFVILFRSRFAFLLKCFLCIFNILVVLLRSCRTGSTVNDLRNACKQLTPITVISIEIVIIKHKIRNVIIMITECSRQEETIFPS